MSMIVVMKMSGDTAAFKNSFSARSDEYRQWRDRAQAAGGLHHRYAVGDGFGFLIDEWESLEAFQQFFAGAEVQAFIASIGIDTSVAPVLIAGEPVDSPDRY
ncbi:MAG: hypothetical protein ACHP7F_06295 [Actinomycetales bacterium]